MTPHPVDLEAFERHVLAVCPDSEFRPTLLALLAEVRAARQARPPLWNRCLYPDTHPLLLQPESPMPKCGKPLRGDWGDGSWRCPDGHYNSSDQLVREGAGRLVREVWVVWARDQANPKPHHLLPWDAISEDDKEVDRRIGETLLGIRDWRVGQRFGNAALASSSVPPPQETVQKAVADAPAPLACYHCGQPLSGPAGCLHCKDRHAAPPVLEEKAQEAGRTVVVGARRSGKMEAAKQAVRDFVAEHPDATVAWASPTRQPDRPWHAPDDAPPAQETAALKGVFPPRSLDSGPAATPGSPRQGEQVAADAAREADDANPTRADQRERELVGSATVPRQRCPICLREKAVEGPAHSEACPGLWPASAEGCERCAFLERTQEGKCARGVPGVDAYNEGSMECYRLGYERLRGAPPSAPALPKEEVAPDEECVCRSNRWCPVHSPAPAAPILPLEEQQGSATAPAGTGSARDQTLEWVANWFRTQDWSGEPMGNGEVSDLVLSMKAMKWIPK